MISQFKSKLLVCLLNLRTEQLARLRELNAPACVVANQERVVAKTRDELARRGYTVRSLTT